jgi:CHASE2 domain-containing sensor protein
MWVHECDVAASQLPLYSDPQMDSHSLRHILSRRSRSEWTVFIVLLVGSAALGNALSSSTVWIDARAAIYQTLSTFGRKTANPKHTAIVLLDDTDYWTEAIGTPAEAQLSGRAPTNRAYLARLVDTLDSANVRLIVLDFDLRSPNPSAKADDLATYDSENQLLFASIRQACDHGHQVVLASELIAANNGVTEARNIYDSANLPGSCVHKGYIELPRDIRRVPVTIATASGADSKSLSLAAVNAVDKDAYEAASSEGERDFPYSQFLPLSAFFPNGPEQSLFTGREIQAAASNDLESRLKSRIVLVGADWHTLALGQGAYADRHPTPAHDLPGVVLHANYIEAELQRGTNKPFPEPVAILLEGLLVLSLSILGMLEIHWAWKWGAVFVSSLGVLIFSYLLLRTFGLMLDFFFPLIFVGLHSGYEHIHEWRHSARKE